MNSNKSSLLPKVGSQAFKALDYKEQLSIYKLLLQEEDKYVALTGKEVTDELQYVDESIRNIFSLPSKVKDSNLAISFTENCWCAYLSYFNPLWWEEGDSPLDWVDVEHKRIFSIQLFNFPLLSLDKDSRTILTWLLTQPTKTRQLSDIFFYLVKLVATYKSFKDQDKLTLDSMVDIWNSSISRMSGLNSVYDINESFPVIEDNPKIIDYIEEEMLSLYTNQVKMKETKKYFLPLVASGLYSQDQFYIKGWDFLEKST